MAISDKRITRDEYLQGELCSEIRHEFVAGNVYAMSGGTMGHQRVAQNFLRLAGNELTGKSCFPTGSAFEVRVTLESGEDAFYYPDGMIICETIPNDALFTDSPTVVLEVLSPSTRRIDETQKLRDYLTIPSLQTYVMAEQDAPFLTIYRRDTNGFRREVIGGLEAMLSLPEVGLRIPLAEIYRDIK